MDIPQALPPAAETCDKNHTIGIYRCSILSEYIDTAGAGWNIHGPAHANSNWIMTGQAVSELVAKEANLVRKQADGVHNEMATKMNNLHAQLVESVAQVPEAVLHSAVVQDLQQKNEQLKGRVDELEAMMAVMRERLEALESN